MIISGSGFGLFRYICICQNSIWQHMVCVFHCISFTLKTHKVVKGEFFLGNGIDQLPGAHTIRVLAVVRAVWQTVTRPAVFETSTTCLR